jgi:hypothetical protein
VRAALFALTGTVVVAAGLATPAIAQHAWRAKSLLEFASATGYVPGAGVITNRLGTIFGTTTIGGNGPCSGGAGCGTVFALSPPSAAGGSWVIDKLYDFQGGQDGSSPSAPLTLVITGLGGNLFAVLQGGDSTSGSLVELNRP